MILSRRAAVTPITITCRTARLSRETTSPVPMPPYLFTDPRLGMRVAFSRACGEIRGLVDGYHPAHTLNVEAGASSRKPWRQRLVRDGSAEAKSGTQRLVYFLRNWRG
jgi:hypothetical protein